MVLDNIFFTKALLKRLIYFISLLNPIAISLHSISPATVSKWVIKDVKIINKYIKYALYTIASNISLILNI